MGADLVVTIAELRESEEAGIYLPEIDDLIKIKEEASE